MALTSGFFNSLNDDRPYDAEQMSSIFDGIIRDGVYETIGDRFMVTPGEGMQVMVGSGRAWFNHTWTFNDGPYPIELEEAETGLNRIDTIVIEVDHGEESRTNRIKVITGLPAENPLPRELEHSTYVDQYPLAEVFVRYGATAISAETIMNKVGTSNCPFVTSVLEAMSIDQIVAQWNAEFAVWMGNNELEFRTWYAPFVENSENRVNSWYNQFTTTREAEFNDWFQHLHDELDSNQAAHLQRQIDEIISIPTSDIDEIWNNVFGGDQ